MVVMGERVWVREGRRAGGVPVGCDALLFVLGRGWVERVGEKARRLSESHAKAFCERANILLSRQRPFAKQGSPLGKPKRGLRTNFACHRLLFFTA